MLPKPTKCARSEYVVEAVKANTGYLVQPGISEVRIPGTVTNTSLGMNGQYSLPKSAQHNRRESLVPSGNSSIANWNKRMVQAAKTSRVYQM